MASSTKIRKEFILKRKSLLSLQSVENLILSLLQSRVNLKEELEFLNDLRESARQVQSMVKLIEKEIKKSMAEGSDPFSLQNKQSKAQ